MAGCGGLVGKDSLIYFLISDDCQTVPEIASMSRLGGFTAKSWENNSNPTTSVTDAYDYQLNSETVKSFTITGSFNAFEDTAQNQQVFLNFFWNYKTLGYEQRKLWIAITDNLTEEVIDYMLIDSVSASKPTDGDSTYDISLSHGGELNPQYTALTAP